MKRLGSVLLCTALILCLGLAAAEGAESDYAWTVTGEETCEITRYTGDETAVVVPGTLGGLRVTGLAASAFSGSAVTHVEIPEGVTSVGSMCFSECRALESVRLPESLTAIGSWAFERTALIRIEIPAGVTVIGDFCFSECRGLETVVLTEGLRELGDCAFMMCTALDEIALPDSLVTVGDNPFCYCTALTEVKLSPEHPALSFLDGALYDGIGRRLICRLCTAPGERFDVPEGCERIGRFALANNTQLQIAVLPEGVTSVGSYAFYHCTALNTAALPASVAEIGESCFDLCVAVTVRAPAGSHALSWAEANGLDVLPAEPEADGSPVPVEEDPIY